MKILIVLTLVIIIVSLGSALYHLLMDKDRTEKTVRALSLRIALSFGLFVLLLIAFASGFIQPHGLQGKPGTTPQTMTAPGP